MPVEIKELVIRAIVDQSPAPSGAAAPASLSDTERERIIRAAVDQALQIWKRNKER